MKKTIALFLLLLCHINLLQAHGGDDVVRVQVLGINDFHGNMEPPSGSNGKINGVEVGGIEYLATHIKEKRAGHTHSITVSAGDLFGASPLLSALFKERPTIEGMNALGLDINAVGNHEFDKGWQHLERLVKGECEEQTSCEQDDFKGAEFQFLAANVVVKETGKTLFPSYIVKQFGPVKVAFVGLVLEGAPEVIVKNSIEGLRFLDEADTVNALMPELEQQGINTVVVLIHEGGLTTGSFNECEGISGAIVDIVDRMNDNVVAVLSGHTHEAYNCIINNKIVTSAASNGRLLTELFLDIDAKSGGLIKAQADNKMVTRDVIKDSTQTEIINKYKKLAAPIADRVIGRISENLTKQENSAGESILGRMIADAQLEASSAKIAFVNPGGIRTDLLYSSSKAEEGDGNVTYSEAYSVQPFGNYLVMMSLTGQEIADVLEQQFAGCSSRPNRVLQVSNGFSYSYAKDGSACQKIDRDSMMLNGERMETYKSYRIVANNFIADGGDGFVGFKKGQDREVGVSDIDALMHYLHTHELVGANHDARITAVEHLSNRNLAKNAGRDGAAYRTQERLSHP